MKKTFRQTVPGSGWVGLKTSVGTFVSFFTPLPPTVVETLRGQSSGWTFVTQPFAVRPTL